MHKMYGCALQVLKSISQTVISTQEQSFGIALARLYNCFAEIMHGMHSGSAATLMLGLFKLVKALVSANMYRMRLQVLYIDFFSGN